MYIGIFFLWLFSNIEDVARDSGSVDIEEDNLLSKFNTYFI